MSVVPVLLTTSSKVFRIGFTQSPQWMRNYPWLLWSLWRKWKGSKDGKIRRTVWLKQCFYAGIYSLIFHLCIRFLECTQKYATGLNSAGGTHVCNFHYTPALGVNYYRSVWELLLATTVTQGWWCCFSVLATCCHHLVSIIPTTIYHSGDVDAEAYKTLTMWHLWQSVLSRWNLTYKSDDCQISLKAQWHSSHSIWLACIVAITSKLLFMCCFSYVIHPLYIWCRRWCF